MAIREGIIRLSQSITHWFEKHLSWRGALALLWLLVKEIPGMAGREAFWSRHLPAIGQFVYTHSTIFTVILVGLIIAVDHHVMMKRHLLQYDLKSLKGRTLKFCDDLRAFQKELGPEPEIKFESGMSHAQFNEANVALAKREQKMQHGFILRFHEQAARLFHEHAAEMRENYDLGNALAARIETDEQLNKIIEQFKQLANMVD